MAADRLAALERMLGNRPDDSRLRYGLALEYLKAGRIEDGVRELRTYLEGSDDQGNAWGRLGASLRELGRDDEALAAYRKGIEAAMRHGHPTMAEEFTQVVEGVVLVTEAETEKTGFEEEALLHLDAVYRFALRLTGSPDQAEDLVQETFLRAYKSWGQYTTGTAAKSWLFTICRNVFLRRRERSQRHDQLVAENAGRDGPGPNPVNPVWVSVLGVDPEGDFFESIVDERIIEAIEALPEEYRTAVVLSDLEGLPYADLAELMDVPVGTVKSRLFRGRRQLQKALYDYAVEMGYIAARTGTHESG